MICEMRVNACDSIIIIIMFIIKTDANQVLKILKRLLKPLSRHKLVRMDWSNASDERALYIQYTDDGFCFFKVYTTVYDPLLAYKFKSNNYRVSAMCK